MGVSVILSSTHSTPSNSAASNNPAFSETEQTALEQLFWNLYQERLVFVPDYNNNSSSLNLTDICSAYAPPITIIIDGDWALDVEKRVEEAFSSLTPFLGDGIPYRILCRNGSSPSPSLSSVGSASHHSWRDFLASNYVSDGALRLALGGLVVDCRIHPLPFFIDNKSPWTLSNIVPFDAVHLALNGAPCLALNLHLTLDLSPATVSNQAFLEFLSRLHGEKKVAIFQVNQQFQSVLSVARNPVNNSSCKFCCFVIYCELIEDNFFYNVDLLTCDIFSTNIIINNDDKKKSYWQKGDDLSAAAFPYVRPGTIAGLRLKIKKYRKKSEKQHELEKDESSTLKQLEKLELSLNRLTRAFGVGPMEAAS